MAPEQLLGEADDARTDIYALGVMLFEMTTGRRPFVKERTEALMFEIFGNAPPSVRSLRPDAPDALDRLVAECLRKEPAERPASAAIVSQTLCWIRAGDAQTNSPLPARRRHSRDRRASAAQRVARSRAGVLRRRDDGGDHLRPRADQGAARDLADVGDAYKGVDNRCPRSRASSTWTRCSRARRCSSATACA